MAQATTKDWLDGIQKGLLKQLTENRGALPKGFNQDRFILNSITVIRDILRDNKKKKQLQEMLRNSVWRRNEVPDRLQRRNQTLQTVQQE